MLTPALLVHACTALHPAVPHASYRPFIVAPRRATLPIFCEQPAKESKHDGAWRRRLATVRTAVSKEVKQWPDAAKEGRTQTLKIMPVALLCSFALSLAIVQLVPSQQLAAAMLTVAEPLIKVVTSCNSIVSKTLLPLNSMIAFLPLCVLRLAVKLKLPRPAGLMFIGLLQAWVFIPINEEILFRGLLQGPLQRVINLRTEPGSQAEKRLMRLLFVAVAVVFSLVHANNLRDLLYRIANPMDPTNTCFVVPAADGTKIGLRFKSVLLVTINQCLVNAFTSFFLFSRLFARRGLVASIAAHTTWNVFSGVAMTCLLLPLNLFKSGQYYFRVEQGLCSQIIFQKLLPGAFGTN